MSERPISLAYSVDADDAFMFHAVRNGRIDTGGLHFTHQRADTGQLNRLAQAGAADVVAISAALYPLVCADYQLLPHGASVGRGFGPVVVAPPASAIRAPRDLVGARVGIPALSTTAWTVLRLIQPACRPVEIPIVPFGAIFEALDRGEVDAALLIHEGRLLYQERGYQKVVDLGEWWLAETGLPLPLGVNVIRRALGQALVATVSGVLRESIRYALGHPDEMLTVLAAEGVDRGDKALSNRELMSEYLNLYANDDTLEMPADARQGIEQLFGRAREAGFVAEDCPVDWAP
jgi:1,4-dihydroxy-6-naphthoate synthase